MSNKKIFSSFFILIIFALLAVNIYKNLPTIKSFNWHFNSSDIIFMLMFLMFVYLINGLSWYLIYRALGAKVTYFKSLNILILGNFARFIPGGIWQYAGRIYLANKAGIPKNLTTLAILTETLLTLLVGAIVIITVGLFWQLPLQDKSLTWIILIAILLVTLAFLLTNKKFIDLISRLLQRLTGKKEIKALRIPPKWIAILLFSFFLQFLIDGAVLFFLARNTVSLPIELFPVIIGIFAASWMLGFITIFAPSGLGVLEVTLASLLSLYMPFSIASVIAIIFRLLLLFSEILTISIVLFLKRINT